MKRPGRLTFGCAIAALLMTLSSAFADPRIGGVDAVWEDTLAVVHPQILEPFSEETRQTLHSGLPVAIDLEIDFVRTGYVKHVYRRVIVEYNVWTDRYRVHTPIGRLAVNDLPTLLRLFRRDLVVTVHHRELPGEGPWFVKARAGERRVLREDQDVDMIGRIEEELSGIAGWIFKRGKKRDTFSEWSELTRLPRRDAAEETR